MSAIKYSSGIQVRTPGNKWNIPLLEEKPFLPLALAFAFCLGFGLCPGLLLIQVPLQSLLPLLCLCLFLLSLFLLLQSFRLHLLLLLQPLFLCPCILLLSGFCKGDLGRLRNLNSG